MGFFTRKNWRISYQQLPDRELLDLIRTGDSLAENYLMDTYRSVVVTHMKFQLRDKPQQLGNPGDYAHDALLLLIEKARLAGGLVLNEYSTIQGWLKQTATYLLVAAVRKDQRNDRDEWGSNDTDDELVRSKVDIIAAEKVAVLDIDPEEERDRTIHATLAALPKELQTLIRIRFMEGHSWKETATLMLRIHPDHDPPFELAYLQKTYWDRVHKKPFIKRLTDNLDKLA